MLTYTDGFICTANQERVVINFIQNIPDVNDSNSMTITKETVSKLIMSREMADQLVKALSNLLAQQNDHAEDTDNDK